MKITIKANPKEITDLVLQLQNQPKEKIFIPEDSVNGKHFNSENCCNANRKFFHV